MILFFLLTDNNSSFIHSLFMLVDMFCFFCCFFLKEKKVAFKLSSFKFCVTHQLNSRDKFTGDGLTDRRLIVVIVSGETPLRVGTFSFSSLKDKTKQQVKRHCL